MRIKDITATVLSNPDVDAGASDSSQDDVLVEITTDEGIVGIGEVDAAPTVIKALIDMRSSHDASLGLKRVLIGEDPLQISKLWDRMYEGNIATGRRGIGVMAMGAIDIALWDLAGKHYGVPVWKLLGGSNKRTVSPYASLPPLQDPENVEVKELRRMVEHARRAGFAAVKIEELVNSQTRDAELVQEARRLVGSDCELMVDAYYCWPDLKTALSACEDLERFGLYFIEAPLPVDDVAGLRRLSRALKTRIATGERLTTRYEFIDLMDRGEVDVVQPDIGRVGGLTEAMRVADHAKTRGVLVVPHCWRTGISIAGALHFAAATPNCPYFEFVPGGLSRSLLRRSLVKREFTLRRGGGIELPERPGLGIEIDYSVVDRCRVDLRDDRRRAR